MLSDRAKAIIPSQTLAITAKANELKASGVDIVSFAAGEPDFDTPQHIKDSAKQAIDNGVTKYTPAAGTMELKKAVCQRFEENYGLSYTPANIAVSNGAKHSLYNIMQAICNAGDEVIVPSPYWVSYPDQVQLAGATVVYLETKEEDSFKIKADALEAVITDKTKALILNSPSNPTGVLYTKNDLQAIADIAVKHNICVISDEIYADLVYDDLDYCSIATLGEDIKNLTIVVNGVSKSYAMTGWRIGYLAASPDIVKAVAGIQSHSTSNPTSIAQVAACTALTASQDCVKEMAKSFQERRNYLVDRLNSIEGITCLKPEGAFYVFPNISKLGLGSMELSARLLEEAHIAVVPGAAFGADSNIRLSYATSMEGIKKGMDRLEDFVKKM